MSSLDRILELISGFSGTVSALETKVDYLVRAIEERLKMLEGAKERRHKDILYYIQLASGIIVILGVFASTAKIRGWF